LQGDVTSALSGNSIMGKNSDESKPSESKMLLFNGLYFRGEWANKFHKLDETKIFNSPKKAQDVKYMTSSGLFKYAHIESQKLVAVEMPYKVPFVKIQ
jgi:serine protease inhibitor